jgi:hypothetical protein
MDIALLWTLCIKQRESNFSAFAVLAMLAIGIVNIE